MKEYYVYILLCSDGSYYTGVTNDWELRLNQHQEGCDPKAYTHSRRPVKLVYLASFPEIYEAIDWEKRVKRWSRKKKEALIKGEYEKLPELSRRYTRYVKNPLCHPEGCVAARSIVSKGDTGVGVVLTQVPSTLPSFETIPHFCERCGIPQDDTEGCWAFSRE